MDIALARLRSLAEAATPGPYEADPYPYEHGFVIRGGQTGAQKKSRVLVVVRNQGSAPAGEAEALRNYIAACSPDTLLKLLDVAEAAKECANDLKAEIEAKYPEATRKNYPSVQSDYDRDMASVLAVLDAVAALGQETGS